MLNGRIRLCTDLDLIQVKKWLDDQKSSGSTDSLLVNWNSTVKQQGKGNVRVYVDPTDNDPIAYFWGSLNSTSSIIEVKQSHRHVGIAREIVEYLTYQSSIAIEPLLLVECAPTTSEGFWRKAGFDILDNGHKIYASQKLNIALPLPDGGGRIDLMVRFLDDEGKFRGAPPLSEHRVHGVKTPTRTVFFDRVLAEFDPSAFGKPGSLFVEIYIGDSAIASHTLKCRHQEAEKVGIQECENGYLIRELRLPL